MPRKGENIRKRKDGRWEGRYRKGRDEVGKIIYGSVYSDSYANVKEKLHKAIAGETVQRATTKSLFEEILDMWLENNRVKHKSSTHLKYKNMIETQIKPALGKLRIDRITASHINAFIDNKLRSGKLDGSGGLAPSYVRSIVIIISSVMDFAVSEEMCKPLKSKIFKPSVKKPDEIKILTKAEQKALENYCLNNQNPVTLSILLSLHAGLRIGEICALRWDDIDISSGMLYIRHTASRIESDAGKTIWAIEDPKTKSSNRDIPMNSFLKSLISDKRGSGFIASGTNKFICPRTFEYRFHRELKNAGISNINYHALRHTFATRCVEAGVDVKSLSEILGHSGVTITLNTYVHSSIEQKRLQLEKLKPIA